MPRQRPYRRLDSSRTRLDWSGRWAATRPIRRLTYFSAARSRHRLDTHGRRDREGAASRRPARVAPLTFETVRIERGAIVRSRHEPSGRAQIPAHCSVLAERSIVRSVMPMISAASHHFRCPAIALRITSRIFVIRSISAAGIRSTSGSTPSASRDAF